MWRVTRSSAPSRRGAVDIVKLMNWLEVLNMFTSHVVAFSDLTSLLKSAMAVWMVFSNLSAYSLTISLI